MKIVDTVEMKQWLRQELLNMIKKAKSLVALTKSN